MKYGIWRHENAFGNSACHALALGKYIRDIKDENPIVYVETSFQGYFALCIPNVKVKLFSSDGINVEYTGDTSIYKNPQFDDIKMPSVYPFKNIYPANWGDILQTDYRFTFPKDYNNKHNLPTDAIVVSIRERGTYWKRVDGSDSEPSRSVELKTFFDIALHYANKGIKVVRIGDVNQTPLPTHENIIDFALVNDRNMIDDLYVISNCKIHISCDSGIWPMTVGFGRKLVLSNVTSSNGNQDIVNWLPKEFTRYIHKENGNDNTFEQLINKVNELI